jgi:hypothetical protein
MTTDTLKTELAAPGELWPDFDPHGILAERAATAWDVSTMTCITAGMTLEEVLAKLLGVTVEEAARVLAQNEAQPAVDK